VSPTRKRAVKKRAPAKKRTPAKSARKAVTKRTRKVAAKRTGAAAPAAARQPRLSIVPRPVPAPLPERSFPQAEGASPRQGVLFELMRARAAFGAAVQGLSGGVADRPMETGKWSARQTVLHVAFWERETIRSIESALIGVAPAWLKNSPADDDRVNREALATLDQHDWDAALRMLHSGRAELLAAIEGVPAEPAEIWTPGHPFGRILQVLIRHDRHHAEVIKRWRASGG
jgi:hypothetical protein